MQPAITEHANAVMRRLLLLNVENSEILFSSSCSLAHSACSVLEFQQTQVPKSRLGRNGGCRDGCSWLGRVYNSLKK